MVGGHLCNEKLKETVHIHVYVHCTTHDVLFTCETVSTAKSQYCANPFTTDSLSKKEEGMVHNTGPLPPLDTTSVTTYL